MLPKNNFVIHLCALKNIALNNNLFTPRYTVYWERINADIESMIKNCSICQENLLAQPKETLQQHDIASRSWEVVGPDLVNCNNHEYLIIAAYYSKFPIIWKMNGLTTSNMIISAMKQVFSEHGIPCRVDSDNGPQNSSEEFKEFDQQWQFDHITSSPNFPKSNGFIERQIQTIKRALIKVKQAGRDPNLALLCLRTTPINHYLPSPAELLNNRILRSNLIAKVSTPIFSNTDHIHEELKHRQDMQKMCHDRTAHDPPLVPGQDVRILDKQTEKWKPATITSRCAEPRSCILQLPDGSSKRRKRVQIRAAETSSHKQVHFNDQITSLQKGLTNTNSISHQRSIKQPTYNTTRSGREIHRPKRYKTNKQGIQQHHSFPLVWGMK